MALPLLGVLGAVAGVAARGGAAAVGGAGRGAASGLGRGLTGAVRGMGMGAAVRGLANMARDLSSDPAAAKAAMRVARGGQGGGRDGGNGGPPGGVGSASPGMGDFGSNVIRDMTDTRGFEATTGEDLGAVVRAVDRVAGTLTVFARGVLGHLQRLEQMAMAKWRLDTEDRMERGNIRPTVASESEPVRSDRQQESKGGLLGGIGKFLMRALAAGGLAYFFKDELKGLGKFVGAGLMQAMGFPDDKPLLDSMQEWIVDRLKKFALAEWEQFRKDIEEGVEESKKQIIDSMNKAGSEFKKKWDELYENANAHLRENMDDFRKKTIEQENVMKAAAGSLADAWDKQVASRATQKKLDTRKSKDAGPEGDAEWHSTGKDMKAIIDQVGKWAKSLEEQLAEKIKNAIDPKSASATVKLPPKPEGSKEPDLTAEQLIRKEEGHVSTIQEYKDSRGNVRERSIGWAHKLKSGQTSVKIGDRDVDVSKGISDKDSEALFQQDLNIRRKEIRGRLGAEHYDALNENQKAALLSYYYNTGRLPTGMLGYIWAGNHDAVADEINNGPKTAAGETLDVLVKRRKTEADLYRKKPSYTEPWKPEVKHEYTNPWKPEVRSDEQPAFKGPVMGGSIINAPVPVPDANRNIDTGKQLGKLGEVFDARKSAMVASRTSINPVVVDAKSTSVVQKNQTVFTGSLHGSPTESSLVASAQRGAYPSGRGDLSLAYS